jgi:hypothetical protein
MESFIQRLDWFSKVRAAKGDFLVWISCRFAGGILNIPACERRFLRCSSAVALRAMADKSVVDVYCLRCTPAKQCEFSEYGER